MITKLAATAVASRYLSGQSFQKEAIAREIGFDPEEVQACIQGGFGSYEEFLRSIIPGLSTISSCLQCRQSFQSNGEDSHCLGCLRDVAVRGIKYLLKNDYSMLPDDMAGRPKWRWIVDRSSELWGCSYKAFVLREFGIVLPISKQKVRRKKYGLQIKSVRWELPKQDNTLPAWPKLGDMTLPVRNKLVEANIRLVWHYARKFSTRFQLRKMDIEDVVQAGMEGLMRAVEKFDPAMGYKFSTYAVWWIRQKIQRAYLEENFSCKLPARYDLRKDECHVTVVTSLDSASSLMEAYLDTASYDNRFDKSEWLETLHNMGASRQAIDLFCDATFQERALPELAVTYNLSLEEVKQLYLSVAERLQAAFVQERGLLKS